MLLTASSQYDRQARLVLVGAVAAKRAWSLGRVDLVSTTLATLQVKAAKDAITATDAALAEQGIVAPLEAAVLAQAFTTASDGRPLGSLLEQADTLPSLLSMVITQIADTGRVAASVSVASRPRLQGYIRHVGPECCSRCAILSGRFYRWSDGFLRHPRCKCTMVPTDRGAAADLMVSPDTLWREGRITDLTAAQQKALEDGADMAQVVNAHRKGAVYTAGGGIRATTSNAKGGKVRLTPEAIYKLASDRTDAIRLLRLHRYIA